MTDRMRERWGRLPRRCCRNKVRERPRVPDPWSLLPKLHEAVTRRESGRGSHCIAILLRRDALEKGAFVLQTMAHRCGFAHTHLSCKYCSLGHQ